MTVRAIIQGLNIKQRWLYFTAFLSCFHQQIYLYSIQIKMSNQYRTRAGVIVNEPPKVETYGGWYIPTYISPDLKWWERDGLLTYKDQHEYKEYKNGKGKWLRKPKVMNFDMNYAQC